MPTVRINIEGLKLTEAEFNVIVNLDERSRCFLVKQGHGAAVCQLNLRGMDDALSVISASSDNIEILHRILQETSKQLGVAVDDLQPEDWLDRFYQERKGSRSKSAENNPTVPSDASQRERDAV